MMKHNSGLQYYLLVVAVGLVAAIFAVALYILYFAIWSFTQNALGYSMLLLPLMAFLAIGLPYGLVKVFADTKKTGTGTHTVLEAYHLSNGNIGQRDAIVKPVAGILTIGLGGSAGPEGPSLLVGGGVAATLSRRLKISADMQQKLFVAGAAAGLAATFRTPLTAILFALEIPYKNDIARELFIEAVIASVPAYLLSITVLGSEPLFGAVSGASLTFSDVGFSLLLGVICGVYTVLFTKIFTYFENLSVKLRKKIGAAGLILLGVMTLSLSGFFAEDTLGVGFPLIDQIIKGTAISTTILILIVIVKTFATAVTLNFGGSGGLFFPTIVVGAGIGYIFSSILNVNLHVMFVAVGMAALLSGTHKILLTPVAFVVETLGGLFAIPALLASGISYLISGKASFYQLQPHTKLKTEELALERFYHKGKALIPEKIKATRASEVMTKNPVSLHYKTSVHDALEMFKRTKLRVLPVVDDATHVIGVITLEDLGNVDVHRREISLSEVVMHNPAVIDENADLEYIAQFMMEKEQDHIFIVDKDGKLAGVISGIDVVKKIIDLAPL